MKKIKLFLLFVFSLFIFVPNVFASMYTCHYEDESGQTSIDVSYASSMAATVIKYKGKSVNKSAKMNMNSQDLSFAKLYLEAFGFCYPYASISKNWFWYNVVVTGKKEELVLKNKVGDNLDNLKSSLKSKSDKTCEYKNQNQVEKIDLPVAYANYENKRKQANVTFGNQLTADDYLKTTDCPVNAYKICSKNGNNCSYTFGAKPSYCNQSDYICKRLPDDATGGNDIKEPKTYNHTYTKRSGGNEFGDLKITVTYDPNVQDYTKNQWTLTKYGDAMKVTTASKDVNSFRRNFLDAIASGKWPNDFYCARISATISLNQNAFIVAGNPKEGDVVCSLEQGSFINHGGINTIVHYYMSKNDQTDPNDIPDIGDIPSSEGDEKTGKDRCSIIAPDGELYKLLQKIVFYVQIGTVLLVIVLGMVDFSGAIASGEDSALKKAGTKFGRRLIACVLVFLVPALIDVFLRMADLQTCSNNLDVFK